MEFSGFKEAFFLLHVLSELPSVLNSESLVGGDLAISPRLTAPTYTALKERSEQMGTGKAGF